MNIQLIINLAIIGVPYTLISSYQLLKYIVRKQKCQSNIKKETQKDTDIKSTQVTQRKSQFQFQKQSNTNIQLMDSERIAIETLSPLSNQSTQRRLVYSFKHNMLKRSKQLQKVTLHIGQPIIQEEEQQQQCQRGPDPIILNVVDEQKEEEEQVIEILEQPIFQEIQSLFLLIVSILLIQSIISIFREQQNLQSQELSQILIECLINIGLQIILFNILLGILINTLNNKSIIKSKKNITKFYFFYYILCLIFLMYSSYNIDIYQDTYIGIFALGWSLPIQLIINTIFQDPKYILIIDIKSILQL